MPLTNHQLFQLMSAGVLLQTRSRNAVSDFEIETIAEVASRFGRFKRDAIVSGAEWQVIDDAVAAMRKALEERRPARASVVAA